MDITEREKEKTKRSKPIIVITISLCILLAIYFGMAMYFTDHFYYGSKINSRSVSGKTVEEVDKQMKSELQSYTLELKERDGKIEKIKAQDIGLKYSSGGKYKNLKDKQNNYKWIQAFFNTDASKMEDEILYNKKLLKEKIDKLSCFNNINIIEPKNPSFKYANNSYIIIEGIKGNKVDKDILYNSVEKAILKEENTIDLETSNCYVQSKYNSNSPKVLEIKNNLNKYVSSKITYTFGSQKETIDGSLINTWIKVNDNLEIKLDEKIIEKHLNKVFNNFNTVGKVRSLNTSYGKNINISGGDYGWKINTNKELQDLCKIIEEGKTVEKEPMCLQTAAAHGNNDVGNTYIEIDMSNQHLWFYKNGSLIVQGDVVTGNVSSHHATPEGVYILKYKQTDTILRGADYSAHVNFWMPFNGGIGIHDAGWRSEFGGSIYMTNGSHGCINAPYNLARSIFKNIEEGTPVICYY